MWFKKLTGFTEENPDQVRRLLTVKDNKIYSEVNKKEYQYGRLEFPSLEELRLRRIEPETSGSEISIKEIVGDIKELHLAKENNGALFQVASQFNLLEMLSPYAIPEDGIGIYDQDHTQGPACAVSCGAGTIYRNYFVPVNGKTGQSADNQINCLYEIGLELGNKENELWEMKNGYVLFDNMNKLKQISDQISQMTFEEYEKLKGKLRTGIQWDTQVTLDNSKNIVSQIYCSALPVSYNSFHTYQYWAPFARLILEATYEASLHVAVENYQKTGNKKVYLTLIGGGVFGNQKEWIFDAMGKAIVKFNRYPLDIYIVSYKNSKPEVNEFIRKLKRSL